MTSQDLEIFNDMPFFWVNEALRAMATEEIVGKKDKELPWGTL